MIDPYCDCTMLDNCIVDYILLTHEHYDHISGVNHWKEHFQTKVLCSNNCARNIESPIHNFASMFELLCEMQTFVEVDSIPECDKRYTCRADETFEDEIIFEWKGHNMRIFELPGHSEGSVGILIDNAHFFSGDSLFEKMEVALRLPGGSRQKWENVSLPRLLELPVPLVVYPGHFSEFQFIKKHI